MIGPVYDGLMSCVWCGCIILGNLEISSVADLGISVIGPHVMSTF